MKIFYNNLLTGRIFVGGMMGFLSGKFIISSTLFAAAAIASIVNITY